MKIVRLSFLFCLSLLLINCSTEETPTIASDIEENLEIPEPEADEPQETPEPETEVYFTLNIDASYESAPQNSEQIQNWIIVHDIDGNVVDYQLFEPGEQIVLEKLPEEIPEKLTITLFNHHFRINEYRHDFETYPNINVGSEWFLSTYKINTNNPTSSSNFTQTITEIPNPEGGIPYHSLTNSTSPIFPETSARNSFGESNLELKNIPFYQDEEYLLIVEGKLDATGSYRYTFLEPSENVALPNLAFNELTQVTLGARFNFPPTNNKFFTARALKAGQSYNDLGFNLINGFTLKEYPLGISSNRSSILIPIIETFDRFQTIVQMNLSGYKWYYVKQGEYANSNSAPEKPIVEFASQDIIDFAFTTDLDYQRKISTWFVRNDNTDNSTSATLRKIHSTDVMYPFIGDIPEELNTLYPSLDLENITYLATDFYLRNESYPDFITNTFEANEDRWNQDLELEIITLFKE